MVSHLFPSFQHCQRMIEVHQLWTLVMKVTAEGNLMEWDFAMQLEHQKRKEVDGRIDWGIMNHIFHPEDWV